MVAFDALEKVDAEPLKLVAADACRESGSRGIEIGFEELIRKGAHGEPCKLTVFPQNGAALRQGDRTMKLVRSTAQGFELITRTGAIAGLRESPAAKR